MLWLSLCIIFCLWSPLPYIPFCHVHSFPYSTKLASCYYICPAPSRTLGWIVLVQWGGCSGSSPVIFKQPPMASCLLLPLKKHEVHTPEIHNNIARVAILTSFRILGSTTSWAPQPRLLSATMSLISFSLSLSS